MKNVLHLLLIIVISITWSSCSRTGKNQATLATPGTANELEVLNGKIKSDTANADLYHDRAMYYLDENQINNALGDINKAIQLNGDKPEYFVTLADIYLAMGKVPNTLESLKKAEKLDPKNNEALIRLAQLYLVMKDYTNCFTYVNSALTVNKQNPQAYFIWGFAQLEMGDTTSAIRNLQTAADQDQNYYDAYLQLGMIYSARKNPLATDYFRSAIQIDSTRTGAYYLMGWFYQETEQFDKAISTYQRLIKVAPEMKEVPYNIGYINLVDLDNYPAAIKYFSECVRIDPNYVDAWFNRGYSYELSGDLESARKDYEKALQVQPNYNRAVEGLNRLDKAAK